MEEKAAEQIEVLERVGGNAQQRPSDSSPSLMGRMVAISKDAARRENLWHRSARFAMKSVPSQPSA